MEPPDGETFASVFARALERRHVSLSWLRDRLAGRGHRISLATLSYWRAGHRVPARLESLEALSEIETLLDVPEGSLAVLARDRRRPRPLPLAFDTVGFGVEDGNVVGEGDVVRVLFHMTVDVDRAQECIESTVTQLFVAARNGVTGVSMFVGPDADGEGNTSRVEAVSGCRLGPVEVREKGIESHWLDFERPCRAGESVLVQTKVIDTGPNVAHETNYGIVAEEKLEECMLLVRFQPDDVPSRCWVAFEEGGVEDAWEVELAGQTTVHHRQTAFGPGTCRVRWEW